MAAAAEEGRRAARDDEDAHAFGNLCGKPRSGVGVILAGEVPEDGRAGAEDGDGDWGAARFEVTRRSTISAGVVFTAGGQERGRGRGRDIREVEVKELIGALCLVANERSPLH